MKASHGSLVINLKPEDEEFLQIGDDIQVMISKKQVGGRGTRIRIIAPKDISITRVPEQSGDDK